MHGMASERGGGIRRELQAAAEAGWRRRTREAGRGPKKQQGWAPLGGACMQMQLQAAARAGWQAGVGKPK